MGVGADMSWNEPCVGMDASVPAHRFCSFKRCPCESVLAPLSLGWMQLATRKDRLEENASAG